MTPLHTLFLKERRLLSTSGEVSLLKKDPWLAANLSMFFPGIGQFYAGKPIKGLIFFTFQLTLLISGVWSIFAPDGKILRGFIILLLAGVFYLFNMLDALLDVHHHQKHENAEKIPRKHKNPWFAVFISRILPGLGHIYLSRSILGLILLCISLIFLQLNNFSDILLFAVPLLTAIAIYDVYLAFPQHPTDKKRSLVAILAGIVFFTGLLGTYLPKWLDHHFEQFIIPSPSMMPTLQVGDRVLVTQSTNYQPQRGDIVVFHPPEALKDAETETAEFFIKRVIGLPGDSISVRQNQVYLNEQALNEPYIAQPPLYHLNSLKVPPNAYFLLGDNRNDSLDSHVWGFLPQELIFGKAYKISWPLNRVQSLRTTSF